MNKIEKPKNEVISRRGEEVVQDLARRRSRNAEISHFLASPWGGRIWASFFVNRRSRILQIRIAPRASKLAQIHSAQLILLVFYTPIPEPRTQP